MGDTELAFVVELPVHGEARVCVQLPGDDGLAFTAVLDRGHPVPSDARGLRFDPALPPLAFVANPPSGNRLGRFRAAPARCFAPYRVVTGGDLPPWDDPRATLGRQHDAAVTRSAGDGLSRSMLDTGFLGSWRLWPSLVRATRRAISEALASVIPNASPCSAATSSGSTAATKSTA